jgi:MOSC domain-containing protein YiiM
MAAGEVAGRESNAHLFEMLNDKPGRTLPVIGQLAGIARRDARLALMQTCTEGLITVEAGLEGDFKGAKYPRRQITVLALEDWEAALADIGNETLPWTARRANLLVAGVRLPRAVGGILKVGDVVLEVTGQTYPCNRMEEAASGLLSALAKAWRGGVTARVLEGGRVALGDGVVVLVDPPEIRPRLPG